MNNVILVGRLTRDVELRYGTSGNAYAHFTLAVDRERRHSQALNQNEPTADFIRVTVFGRQAENCQRYLGKGSQAAIQGRIQTGSYVDKDGKKVYTTDVMAYKVEFVGGSRQQRNPANNQTDNWNQTPRPENYQPPQNSQPPQQSGQKNSDLPEGFAMIDEDDIPF